MRLLACILAISSSLLIGNAFASTVKIGILNFPPLYKHDGSGKVGGLLTSLLRRVTAKAGFESTVTGYSPTQLYKNLKVGKSHIFIGPKGNPLYDNDVLYSKYPCARIELRIYALADLEIPKKIEGLAGKKLMAIRSYGYGEVGVYLRDPKNGVQFDYNRNYEEVFERLKSRPDHYVLGYARTAELALKKVKIPNIKFRTIATIDNYITVSKKAPNAKELIKKLEKAYRELRSERKVY